MSSVDVSGGGFRLDPDLDPWEQQPGEGDDYFLAFKRYLRLGRRVNTRSREPLPRSVSDMLEDVDWSARHLRRVCAEFLWRDRAFAWDLMQEGRLGGELEDARVRILRGWVAQAEEINGFILEGLRSIDVGLWKPRDLVELYKVKYAVEMALVGLSNQVGSVGRVGVSLGVDVGLPVGEGTGVIEGQMEEIFREVLSRQSGDGAGGGVSGGGVSGGLVGVSVLY